MCKGVVTSTSDAQTNVDQGTRVPPPVVPPECTLPDGRKSAFFARRLAPTTFLIVEVDDEFYEHPFIYAKRVPAARALVLLDTGCGGRPRRPDVELTSLREFIETAPVAGAGDDGAGSAPLNPGGALAYVVVLSHCHFDHILGVEQFAQDSLVIASGYDPTFISPQNLPEHSLCIDLDVPTPTYSPTLLSHGADVRSKDGLLLGMILLHTPGHTPDEIALWDTDEAMLYVGDTLYEWEPIVFPNEGSIVRWLATIDELIALVEASGKGSQARISCGHRTAAGPALEVLRTTKAFVRDVIEGREQVKRRLTRRGEEHVKYAQESGRYSLICPERLVEEAKGA